jgi:hypothetical protein
MKTVRIIAAAIALATGATGAMGATSAPASASETARQETCVLLERFADTVMHAKQAGLPLTEIMGLLATTKSEALRVIGRAMTLDAYEQPDYSTQGYKDQQRTEFKTKWAVTCYKATSGGGQ